MPLSDLDWLVFSAHKTATQSLKFTLIEAGRRADHAHELRHLGLRAGQLRSTMRDRHRSFGAPLQIVSVFRLPIERHVSSLFQWYGDRPLRENEVGFPSDTVIARESDEELRDRLVEEVTSRTLVGQEESIPQLCEELGVASAELDFDPVAGSGRTVFEDCALHLLRFDQLVNRVGDVVAELTGEHVSPRRYNFSRVKWYGERYRTFIEGLELPRSFVTDTMEERRPLLELFYPGRVDEVIAAEIRRWCRPSVMERVSAAPRRLIHRRGGSA
jgi:hypothetical protein